MNELFRGHPLLAPVQELVTLNNMLRHSLM